MPEESTVLGGQYRIFSLVGGGQWPELGVTAKNCPIIAARIHDRAAAHG